jgi:hypothetical protein
MTYRLSLDEGIRAYNKLSHLTRRSRRQRCAMWPTSELKAVGPLRSRLSFAVLLQEQIHRSLTNS